MHESFARNLTSAVGGHLRDNFEVALVAVEQLAYRDFLARFPDTTCYSTFHLPPNDACGCFISNSAWHSRWLTCSWVD